ncbi:MAG: DUF4302 domain-containing protein [Odoribacter splanchnicus]
MKRVISIIGMWLAMSACSIDNDYIFDDISTARLNQYIAECDETLLSSEQGWKMVYYPDTLHYGGYTFLMKFSDEKGKRVEMMSDLVDTASVSAYSYNAAIGPVLNFDTYGLLHLLADPNPSEFGGNAGLGYNGEYEFLITKVEQDKISLLSKKNKREAALVRATAEDWENLKVQRKVIADFSTFIPVEKNQPFYHYLCVGNDTAFCYYSPKLRMAYLTYVEGGETVALSLPSSSTTRGIRFNKPIVFGGQAISELAFNAQTRQMSVLDEGVNAQCFWAKTTKERCLIQFPKAVEMVRKYSDAFSLIERGYNLLNGKTDLSSFDDVQDFRWHWNLAGCPAFEIYVKDEMEGINCTLGHLYDKDSTALDNVGDRIFFEQLHPNSKHSGNVNNMLVINFSSYARTVIDPWLETDAGVLMIPVGGQFYLIKNDDNLSWALFSPLQSL